MNMEHLRKSPARMAKAIATTVKTFDISDFAFDTLDVGIAYSDVVADLRYPNIGDESQSTSNSTATLRHADVKEIETWLMKQRIADNELIWVGAVHATSGSTGWVASIGRAYQPRDGETIVGHSDGGYNIRWTEYSDGERARLFQHLIRQAQRSMRALT